MFKCITLYMYQFGDVMTKSTKPWIWGCERGGIRVVVIAKFQLLIHDG